MVRAGEAARSVSARLLSVAAVTVVVVGTTCTATAQAGAPGGTAVQWQPCGVLQCTTVTVPVDWSRPLGAKLTLGVAELPALTQPALGTVMGDSIEPDGVGSSNIAFLQQHSSFFTALLPQVHQFLNIVAVDPRGFGTSDPLSCTVPALDPSLSDLPTTPSALAQLLAHDRAVALGCSGSGDLLSHLDMVSQARDLDAVREALGIAKIRFFGQTDGALLGATYAELYPGRVAEMVLDGVADHQLPTLPRLLSVARAGEDSFDRFAAWCQATSACALYGQDVGAAFDSVVTAANQGRLGSLTGTEIQLTTSHLVLGEHTFQWALLGQAIQLGQQGDATGFLGLISANSEYADPGYTASRAAGCADYPSTPADLVAFARLSRQFPHLGGINVWSDLAATCAGWPIPATNPPHPIQVSGVPPILIVNTTHDSTTPYAWAVNLARHIDGSRLLTVNVDGHLGLDNSVCAAQDEDTYLVYGTLPAPGAVCDN